MDTKTGKGLRFVEEPTLTVRVEVPALKPLPKATEPLMALNVSAAVEEVASAVEVARYSVELAFRNVHVLPAVPPLSTSAN